MKILVSVSKMNTKLTIVFILLNLLGFSNISNAQNVNIPDAIFKALLVGNPLINTNGDAEIQDTEAMAFAGTIDVHYQEIYDLTGIEAFRNLKVLDCSECKLSNLELSRNTSLMILNCMINSIKSLNVSDLVLLTELNCGYCQLVNLDISANTTLVKLNCSANNLITNLDVSKNTSLEELGCYNNLLTSLDVSKNTSLKYLDCKFNPLTSLDVSKNKSLNYLDCAWNHLTNLNVSANTALNDLRCYLNQLVSLDLSANQALNTLECNNNYLTSLDVSSNVALWTLSCGNNQLTNLDVSSNVALWGLSCENNQLTSLDLSANIVLTGLDCTNNLLTNLNDKNGNNHSCRFIRAENNPGLKCIQVDNALYSNDNWSSRIDPWATFNETCTVGVDNISQTEVNIFPNPSNGIFTISGLPMGALCIDIYNVLGEIVYSKNSTQTVSNIDISNSPKGMYFVKISDGMKVHTTKIEIK